MWSRPYWVSRIEEAWAGPRSVLWLSGVRRVGKTTLCRSLPDIEYFDCELPRHRRALEDLESFLGSMRGRRVVLDEIHRLPDPSALLKIAADHYPDVKVLATGSSTLGATHKFRDTLTGRKAELWLTPAISHDLPVFRIADLTTRLHRGGLPPFLLAPALPERDFQEWLDAYWARDIQELFRLERRSSFVRFVELLLAASGGVFEATRFARAAEASRPTITNYLAVLETTLVAHVIRPFSTGKAAEIVAAPKVYGFDTGFVAYFRGWHSLRPDDLGLLWEHYVLNELQARLQLRTLNYWRDKQGHEVDFVLVRRRRPPLALECKWSADGFDPRSLQAFRRRYPKADCRVVAQDVDRSFTRRFGELAVTFVSLERLVASLEAELGA